MVNSSQNALQEDAVRSLWLPVTVEVAWALLHAGVGVAEHLANARAHVVWSLPAGADHERAVRVTGPLVSDYLERIGSGTVVAAPPLPPAANVPEDWKHQLLESLDPLGEAIFRLHFGDGLSLSTLESHLGVDQSALVAARCGCRDLLRMIAGRSMASDTAVDEGLRALATRPAPGCPGPMGLMSEPGRRHADDCPRCSRAVRLLRAGHIELSDLFPPTGGIHPFAGRVEVYALLLHPDARRHERRVRQALGSRAVQTEVGCWLMPLEAFESALPALAQLCEESKPVRHHLRGARHSGAGRWAAAGPLGPVPVAALETARQRPWAELGGNFCLPVPLPPPPSAALWWAAALLITTLMGAVGAATAQSPRVDPVSPVVAQFSSVGTGWSVRFDSDDLSVVDVVVDAGDGLKRVSASTVVGKGAWATGEGDFAIEVAAPRVAVLSSPDGLPDLDAWITEVGSSQDALQRLAQRIRRAAPAADVALSPVVTAEKEI